MKRYVDLVVVMILFVFVLGGCATQWARSTKNGFADALQRTKQDLPTPLPCDTGYGATAEGYIVALTEWAETAGLHLGDRITAIGGASVDAGPTRLQALKALRSGEPYRLTVMRRGQTVEVTMPCRDNAPTHTARMRLLRAGASGDWDDCVEATLDYEKLRGFREDRTTRDRLKCEEAKRREGPMTYREARYLYEYGLALLRLAVYEPGGVDQRRGELLTHATYLRRNGFVPLAADLESELDRATRSQTADRNQPGSPRTGSAGSRGTGFVVRPDGHLLTSFHVVENAKTITARCPGQTAATATIATVASSNDLAVLKTAQTGLRYLSLGRTRSVQLGDSVFTIGFPTTQLLGTDPKFSDGSVSALSGPGGEASLLQVTIPVQPGNSGGPMLNAAGQVVGIIAASAAIRPFLSATGTLPQNINWAVKADYALPLFDQPLSVSAKSRGEVIDLALSATCLIEVER